VNRQWIESANSERSQQLNELAALVVTGDRAAARQLLVETAPAMLRVVRGVLGFGHPDVEDVAQEAAIALISALRSFRGECGVLHFACRVAVMTALAARRRLEVRMRWAEDRLPDAAVSVASEEVASECMAGQRRAVLRDLLCDIPEAQAETLVMSAVLGCSPQEIGEITGVPANTVRSRLRLAKAALRFRIGSRSDLAELLKEVP
jgi:RNA polymerase sigma factor (sigma-70 family)